MRLFSKSNLAWSTAVLFFRDLVYKFLNTVLIVLQLQEYKTLDEK